MMDPVLLMLMVNQSVLVMVNGQDVIVLVSINTGCKISGIPCSSNLCLIFIPSNEVARGYSNATVRPSVRHNPCEHSRINILQWILIKLGTYLVLKRVWNPIDFQGQGHWVNFLPCNILVNTLESTSFNGF